TGGFSGARRAQASSLPVAGNRPGGGFGSSGEADAGAAGSAIARRNGTARARIAGSPCAAEVTTAAYLRREAVPRNSGRRWTVKGSPRCSTGAGVSGASNRCGPSILDALPLGGIVLEHFESLLPQQLDLRDLALVRRARELLVNEIVVEADRGAVLGAVAVIHPVDPRPVSGGEAHRTR